LPGFFLEHRHFWRGRPAEGLAIILQHRHKRRCRELASIAELGDAAGGPVDHRQF